jgi:7-cyano-7-deazaguanine synthase
MSPKTEKAVALLSGGLDSTVTLVEGLQAYDVVRVLTVNYGQRAFGKEIRASRHITEHYGLRHEIVALPWLSNLLPKAMMMRRDGVDPAIPPEWDEGSERNETFFEAKPVWIPNRNGLFLNIAASYAEALGAQIILFGANIDEAERFPDNTEAFRERINNAFQLSTLSCPRVEAPLAQMTKTQIVERAKALGAPLHLIWSCYTDTENQCGNCPSCYRLKNALRQSSAGAQYLKQIAFIQ